MGYHGNTGKRLPSSVESVVPRLLQFSPRQRRRDEESRYTHHIRRRVGLFHVSSDEDTMRVYALPRAAARDPTKFAYARPMDAPLQQRSRRARRGLTRQRIGGRNSLQPLFRFTEETISSRVSPFPRRDSIHRFFHCPMRSRRVFSFLIKKKERKNLAPFLKDFLATTLSYFVTK